MMQRLLPFDSGSRFLPTAFQWRDAALSDNQAEILGDLLCIQTLVPRVNVLSHPFEILEWFGIPADPRKIGERVWEVVEDIRMQVFQEMLALTGEEYRLDWSRRDGSFCLWYRDRNHQRDATRELHFVRSNTIPIIPETEIRESRVHGFGLFATADIQRAFIIAELDGQVMDFDAYERLRSRLGFGLGRLRSHFFMEWNALSEDRILARPLRTTYSYINHSDHPNIEAMIENDHVRLRTLRDLEAGEELLLDYRKESLPRGYFDQPGSAYLDPAFKDQ